MPLNPLVEMLFKTRIEQRPDEGAAVALVRVGLMACTPSSPSIAVSFDVLEQYHYLRRHAPRLSVQAYVKALCDIHLVRLARSSSSVLF